MIRTLLLIVLIWILYVVLKRFIASIAANNTKARPASSEKIVACSHCGLHIPENETHTINNMVYCNNPDCQPK